MGRRIVATGGVALRQSRRRATRGKFLGFFLAPQGATETQTLREASQRIDNIPGEGRFRRPIRGGVPILVDPRVSLRSTRGYIPWPHSGPKTNGWSSNNENAQPQNLRVGLIRVRGLARLFLPATIFKEAIRSMRNQSRSLLLLFLSLLGHCDASRAAEAPDTAKPNVLFLFADDQRADTIAALGNPIIRTPNLDRLVRSGMSFNRAYMQGSMQPATCVPSRAMLLSGRSLFHIDEKLLRDETWPAAFGKAGYTTFMTGKWHNGARSLPACFQIARSVFDGGMTDPMKAKLSDLKNGKLTPPRIAPRHACEIFADEAVRFLGEHHSGPFFGYVAFDAPHDPHIVPDNFPIHYDPDKMPLPKNFMPQHPFDNGEMKVRDELLLPWPRTEAKVRTMNAEYYRYISYLDSQIGRVLDALERSPYAKNTIVVFSADSGVARGSHGLIGKQNLYEHSLRVPLIVSGPGIPGGKTTDALCYLFDVLPTLGMLCGVAAPRTSEGTDLSPVLRNPEKAGRTQLMFAYKSAQRALCNERWKLIRYPLVDKNQLFDLKADPNEVDNLAYNPGYAERVADLTARLEQEMARYGDKLMESKALGHHESRCHALPSAPIFPSGSGPELESLGRAEYLREHLLVGCAAFSAFDPSRDSTRICRPHQEGHVIVLNQICAVLLRRGEKGGQADSGGAASIAVSQLARSPVVGLRLSKSQ